MAVNTLVTEGFGNGTFSGTIALSVTHGYAIGAVSDAQVGPGGSPVPTVTRAQYLDAGDYTYMRATQEDRLLTAGDLDYMRRVQEGT